MSPPIHGVQTKIGRVWWNLSTVKFIDPYTDIVGASAARDLAELQYRVANWASVAPSASVDVYEWTKSSVPPSVYSLNSQYPGTIYNASTSSWVEEIVYGTNGSETINYYFWVSGLTVVPDVSFRKTDITTVAMGIQNPSGLDLAWMAPVNTDAMIVSGVIQFLMTLTAL